MHSLSILQLASFGILFQGTLAAVVDVPPGLTPPRPEGFEKREVKKCNADNCARAVTGTFRGLQATRLADCSAFMQCTVTPVPITQTTHITETLDPVTETSVTGLTETSSATVTVTQTLPWGEVKRRDEGEPTATPITNCPSVVPTYASACSGVVRYESACACGGISKSYTTLEAETIIVSKFATETPDKVIIPSTSLTTITNTATATATVNAYPTDRVGVFVEGGPYDGQRLVSVSGNAPGGYSWRFWPSANWDAYVFQSDGTVIENGYDYLRLGPNEELGVPYSRGDANWLEKIKLEVTKNAEGKTYIKAIGSRTVFQICPTDGIHPSVPWGRLSAQLRPGCTELTALRLKVIPNQ
ncbi:hypothetical protein B0I35DRAFT_475546 [Stachybotrys elegans]|uniref:PA14 domain-containing protein n=1 Tax=Stachybotrys elegans TaxID=80388 RepID=A0A8K0WTM0_9HYPO|nr:hypothetical protein B0I35DRAFT_475546 [Stachybotrys elegans]